MKRLREFKRLAPNRHASGESIAGMARELGVSKCTVARWLREAGIASKPGRKHGPEIKREFARMYSSTRMTWEEIAHALGVTKGLLIKWREAMQLPTRSSQSKPTETRMEFERLYRETPMGARAIAKRLGVSAKVAQGWRRKTGLLPKPKANAQWSRARNLWAGWCDVFEKEQAALLSVDMCWGRHPDVVRARAMDYYYANHESSKAYGRANAKKRHARLGKTALWKIRAAARNACARIARATSYRWKKSLRTEAYLGCTYDFAREYLAERFKPGMTWENHGAVWHIDHVKPLASFDLMKKEARAEAMHYTNLQPLFAPDNRAKSAKLDWEMGRRD